MSPSARWLRGANPPRTYPYLDDTAGWEAVIAELHVFEAMPHGGFGGAPEDAEYASEVRRFRGSVGGG